MGIMNKVKSVFSGSNKEDEIEQEIREEEVDDEEQVNDEPDLPEFDTYYMLAKYYLQKKGFTGIKEFTERAMYDFVDKTREDTNVLETGMSTLSQLSSAKDELDNIKGGNEGNLDNMTDKINKAVEVKEGIKKLKGEEDMWKRDAMKLGRMAIGALGNSNDSEVDIEE